VLLSLNQVGVLGLVLWPRLYNILEEEDAEGSQSIPAPPMQRGSVLGSGVRLSRNFGFCELPLRRRGYEIAQFKVWCLEFDAGLGVQGFRGVLVVVL
jgi:hypothetical protein